MIAFSKRVNTRTHESDVSRTLYPSYDLTIGDDDECMEARALEWRVTERVLRMNKRLAVHRWSPVGLFL